MLMSKKKKTVVGARNDLVHKQNNESTLSYTILGTSKDKKKFVMISFFN